MSATVARGLAGRAECHCESLRRRLPALIPSPRFSDKHQLEQLRILAIAKPDPPIRVKVQQIGLDPRRHSSCGAACLSANRSRAIHGPKRHRTRHRILERHDPLSGRLSGPDRYRQVRPASRRGPVPGISGGLLTEKEVARGAELLSSKAPLSQDSGLKATARTGLQRYSCGVMSASPCAAHDRGQR